eukprot:2482734-Alexandrium_andersonii.AAC.1
MGWLGGGSRTRLTLATKWNRPAPHPRARGPRRASAGARRRPEVSFARRWTRLEMALRGPGLWACPTRGRGRACPG